MFVGTLLSRTSTTGLLVSSSSSEISAINNMSVPDDTDLYAFATFSAVNEEL